MRKVQATGRSASGMEAEASFEKVNLVDSFQCFKVGEVHPHPQSVPDSSWKKASTTKARLNTWQITCLISIPRESSLIRNSVRSVRRRHVRCCRHTCETLHCIHTGDARTHLSHTWQAQLFPIEVAVVDVHFFFSDESWSKAGRSLITLEKAEQHFPQVNILYQRRLILHNCNQSHNMIPLTAI